MDAKMKRDFADLIERWCSSESAGKEFAAVLRAEADAEDPTAWTPKFKAGDWVRFKADKSTGGQVVYVGAGRYHGRVALAGQMISDSCPHEDDLELGEPIPEHPVPLGPEDRVVVRGAQRIIEAVAHDAAWFGSCTCEPLNCITRIGPPAEIAPGRAVHVLDEQGEFNHEALAYPRSDGQFDILRGRSDGGTCWTKAPRHRLRLAACLAVAK